MKRQFYTVNESSLLSEEWKILGEAISNMSQITEGKRVLEEAQVQRLRDIAFVCYKGIKDLTERTLGHIRGKELIQSDEEKETQRLQKLIEDLRFNPRDPIPF